METSLFSGSFRKTTDLRGCSFQVLDKCFLLLPTRIVVLRPQDGRWMYGCHDVGGKGGRNKLSSLPRNAEFLAQQSLCGGGSQTDDHLRTGHGNFSFEPRATSLNFGVTRLFVNAALAALIRHPTEMLHYVGYVQL